LEKLEGAERLKNMPFAEFLVWFWNPDSSEYIRDRTDAERPLSKVYLRDQARNVKKYASKYPLFNKTALRDITLYCMEQWIQHLKRTVKNSNLVVYSVSRNLYRGIETPQLVIKEIIKRTS
jgi:hypothetical protein